MPGWRAAISRGRQSVSWKMLQVRLPRVLCRLPTPHWINRCHCPASLRRVHGVTEIRQQERIDQHHHPDQGDQGARLSPGCTPIEPGDQQEEQTGSIGNSHGLFHRPRRLCPPAACQSPPRARAPRLEAAGPRFRARTGRQPAGGERIGVGQACQGITQSSSNAHALHIYDLYCTHEEPAGSSQTPPLR